ncbi:urate oxidase [Jatrophihabitans sp. GAS493]|uniref:factor-independent urate hydroxylase n=1 Tax=Jatrophihabitans sp. GAS493 TaxID=1907575 RepID=UPI000BB9B570|nr:urate oxidase [Jatrophihabitans sp. GAS493]SOD71127.1 urate oxidase [Jatrophihabitans sp. GAS493]
MSVLGFNRYGKAEVRVVHVSRGTGPDGGDQIKDWNVSSSLSGDLAATHLTGDNANVLATDTQKNTAYAFAKKLGGVEPEAFAIALAEHFVGTQEPITRARLSIEEYPWTSLPGGPHSFSRTGGVVRTTTVLHDEQLGTSVIGGLKELVVLNTTNSEFFGFPKDPYTTLSETKDRMLATQVSATWRFRGTEVEWADAYATATASLLDAFATTYSYSLQQTLYAMGERILADVPEICEVRLALPNKHHFLVDLEPFDLTNDNEVYYAADRPYGLIEGYVLADDAPDAGIAWT